MSKNLFNFFKFNEIMSVYIAGNKRKNLTTIRIMIKGSFDMHLSFVLRAAMVTVMIGLSACSPGSNLPRMSDTLPGPYHLGVGDEVKITTIGGDQLTGTFHVGDSGDVAVPFVGQVPANGLTTQEFAANIAQKLQDKKLFNHPDVVAEVMVYRPVFVLGEVTKPGKYPYIPGMTVLSLVSVAGGFTYRAVTGYASDVHTPYDGHPIEGRVVRSSLVQPGDVVTVFERTF
jgi:polysaccharide biosynthesis/export protein